ncbi:hypothetical protein SAMN05216276_107846 [Streptosporangium subroseum]|uniref:PE family protein n=1 Tax=Streptosporangium subroseum TaxID=106412 RepID=A0A239P0Y1_9ACTN|nr:hypothetical protein [Streptosporangium subroseum]SNT60670.1 hypothetical protein SAMN05216276_107846 [Streptosporangium subroseum]
MDADDLARFGEATRAADERRALEMAELYEAAGLLAEVTRAVATLANHLQAEAAALPGRYILRDDTGDDPGARLAEIRRRMEQMVELLQKAELHARRSHAAIGHLGVEIDPAAES